MVSMMTIDPRLADRRREVAEDRARRNINRLLKLLVLLGVLGALVWLMLSPTFSLQTLRVTGVHSSDTEAVIEEHQLVIGRPMIFIRTGSVESDILEDPWVKSAEVRLDWPTTVVVSIEERSPEAWVETAGGWEQRSVDGVALPGLEGPDDTMGRIVLPDVPHETAHVDLSVIGALEFLDALPIALSSAAVVERRGEELWAIVGGFDVRLGRPTDMTDKALSLAALLGEDLPAGSVINMTAPTNPAVAPPASEEEAADDDEGTAEGGGENDGDGNDDGEP